MKSFKIDVEILNISAAMNIVGLKLGREVARKEIAEALGVERQTAIKNKNRKLTPEEIKKIERFFNISLTSETTTYIDNPSQYPGKKELKYWGEGLPCEEKIKNPLVTSIMWDREVINGVWQVNEDGLFIIAMPGDKMDGGTQPYRNGDALIIDTDSTDISISGVYFYTTNNNEDVFVNNIRKRFDGTIVLGFTNPKYEDSIVTQEELDAVGFNVVGRVIHNIFEKS